VTAPVLRRSLGRVIVVTRRASGAGGERGEAFEGAHDRGGPGPVGGQVQGAASGVAGELGGDVQQPLTQAFGFTDLVFAVQEQRLGPRRQGVCGQRELKPRLVGLEIAEPGPGTARGGLRDGRRLQARAADRDRLGIAIAQHITAPERAAGRAERARAGERIQAPAAGA